jgi:DNA-binding winged helix-turn-helix (wHTH) protein/TolB-like protein
MSAVPGQVLQIGEWSVDPALGEIASGGRVTKLDPLTMRLLLYFADNAGRVVALQELLDAVWPNVVVTPQSVYNTVAQLRRTLGDLAEAPTYIANIPRKGYRLIAKVEHRQVERRAAPAATPASAGTSPSAAMSEPLAMPQPPASPALVDVPAPRSNIGAPRVLVIAILAVVLIGLIALVLAQRGVFGSRSAVTDTVDHSIAVLPFRDLSEAQDRAYLAEGLAEQIGTVLSGVPKLRVIGRASAFASRTDNIPDIAKKLHVDHVLEGSVQSYGRRPTIGPPTIISASRMRLPATSQGRSRTPGFRRTGLQAPVGRTVQPITCCCRAAILGAATRAPIANGQLSSTSRLSRLNQIALRPGHGSPPPMAFRPPAVGWRPTWAINARATPPNTLCAWIRSRLTPMRRLPMSRSFTIGTGRARMPSSSARSNSMPAMCGC